MEMRALPLSSHNCCPPTLRSCNSRCAPRPSACSARPGRVWAMTEEKKSGEEGGTKKKRVSLFGSITEALDFSQVRSSEDAVLIEDAREVTKSGKKMTREQVLDGQYVEEGWVDKTCKVCKKDTGGEPRQVDKLGRYVHVACLEKPNTGNFFSRLFSG
ncbi:hypothetical protein GW17_00058774 [Ensete ventricosum]|uniref:Uncharacterized protein n=1 Tax=Ensete ventricosum TaxID=4639 RepID=A0A444C264_ENSVE|nr:hypothetical protein GW17_00058774 [Ensete ventricosum]RZR72578.1 hypothetical protein BHM03_00014746 [Ensete ventricosum]